MKLNIYAFTIVGTALVGLVYLSFLFIPILKEIPEYPFWLSQEKFLRAQVSASLEGDESESPASDTTPESGPGPASIPGPDTTPSPSPSPAPGFGPSPSPGPSHSPSPSPSPSPTPVPGPGPSSTPIPTPLDQEPSISINTYIISGPKKGEIIEETNRVTFEFEARVSPEETEGYVRFETKIEGIDEDWQSTYSDQRTIDFPSGPKEYTFLVRAKINDIIDPTPAKRTFKINTSPYFGKVEIYRVQTPSSYYPSSLITLSSYLEREEEIKITDWRIEGQKGGFTIPQGIEKYNHLFYSQLFGNNVPLKDILVKYNDTIYLSSASNPLGSNKNFRLNRCFGYLANERDFAIDFYNNCPIPERYSEEILDLNPPCQRYVLERRSCEIPKYWENPEVARDSECVDYILDNFNYIGCYKNYSKDEDFLENEWHIYMNRNFVSEGLDILYLRDQNGLLIDKYLYGLF